MTISAIAAVGRSWQIGLNGTLPWERHDEDMRWFREITKGKVMVAGHRTYESLKHIEWDLDRELLPIDREFSEDQKTKETIIIGGAGAYDTTAPFIKRLYLSQIDYDGPADTSFPIAAFSPEIIREAVWRPE